MSTTHDREAVQNEILQLQEQALKLRENLRKARLGQVRSNRAQNLSIEKYASDAQRDDLHVKDFKYSYEPVKGTLFVHFSTKKSGQGEVLILTHENVPLDVESINDGSEVSLGRDISKSDLELFFINIERKGKMVTKKVHLS